MTTELTMTTKLTKMLLAFRGVYTIYNILVRRKTAVPGPRPRRVDGGQFFFLEGKRMKNNISYSTVESVKNKILSEYQEIIRSEEFLHYRDEPIKRSVIDIVILALLKAGLLGND